MPETAQSFFAPSHAVMAFIAIALLVAFFNRVRLFETVERFRNSRRRYLHIGGFAQDLENGFSSRNFDISTNIAAGDQRSLNEEATQQIRAIMEAENIGFDEARAAYFRDTLDLNNIDENGVPRDPRTVTF